SRSPTSSAAAGSADLHTPRPARSAEVERWSVSSPWGRVRGARPVLRPTGVGSVVCRQCTRHWRRPDKTDIAGGRPGEPRPGRDAAGRGGWWSRVVAGLAGAARNERRMVGAAPPPTPPTHGNHTPSSTRTTVLPRVTTVLLRVTRVLP